jgi:hypothetical protein
MIGTSKNIWGFDPRSVGSCQFWLDAADQNAMTLSGSSVVTVLDKSGNGKTLSGGTGWTYNVTKFNVSYPSFYRATTGSMLGQNTTFALTSPNITLFFVGMLVSSGSTTSQVYLTDGAGVSTGRFYNYADYTGGADNNNIVHGDTVSTARYPVLNSRIFSPFIFSQSAGTNPQTGSINGTTINATAGTVGSMTVTGLTIGGPWNSTVAGAQPYTWPGHICEVLIYSSALTTSQRQQVEGYLGWKWGIQTLLPSVSYVAPLSTSGFSPTSISNCVLWNNASTLSGFGAVNNWPNPQGGYTVNCTGQRNPGGRNGLNTVLLTTAQTWIPSPDVSLSAYTLFWSGRKTSTGAGRVLQGTANNHLYGYWSTVERVLYVDANPGILNGPTVDTTWDTFSHARTPGGSYVFNWNGQLHSSNTTSSGNGMTGLRINSGASPAETSAVEVGEIILYSRFLTSTEISTVDQYLMNKWGVSNTVLVPTFSNANPYVYMRPHLRTFQPNTMLECALWLDGADPAGTGTPPANGSTVSTWVDKSGYRRNATANVGGSAITMGTLNNLPAISFPAASTAAFLPSSLSVGSGGYSVFFVANQTSFASGGTRIYSANSGGVQSLIDNNPTPRILTVFNGSSMTSSFTIIANTPFIYSYTISPTAAGLWKNGFPVATAGGSTGVISTFYVGNYSEASALYAFTGQMGEFIVFNTGLTDSQRQQVEGYLAYKWGLVSSLSQSTSFSPSNIAGCQLWLDASDSNSTTLSGSTVTVWNDKSGNNRHMNTITVAANWTPSTAELPIIGTPIGGLRTINFKAQSGIKQATTLDGVKNLFWVGRTAAPVGTPGSTSYFLLGHDVNYDWHGNPYNINGPNFFINTTFANAGIQSASPVSLFTQGETPVRGATFSNVIMPLQPLVSLLSAGGITGTTRYQGLCYDRNGGNIGWCGDLAEVIIYSNALTTDQRTQVENYLLQKWKITTLHSFRSFPPASIASRSISSFSPRSISGLLVWLDGTDTTGTGLVPVSGGTVSTWVDKSGNGYNFTQASISTSLPSVSYNTNGIGVYFGSLQGLNNTTVPFPTSYTIFAVANQLINSGASAYQYLLHSPHNADYIVFFGSRGGIFATFAGSASAWNDITANSPASFVSIASSSASLLCCTNNGTTLTPYFNTVAMTTKVGTNASTTGMIIGSTFAAGSPQPWLGTIYEIVVYNSVLTTAQRERVEGYLAYKWKIPIFTPITYTFNFTGSLQSWTPPASVTVPTTVTVTLRGAGGGGGYSSGVGGAGGTTTGTLAVTPGQIYSIVVGGGGGGGNPGTSAGGYGGGGTGGANSGAGGGGGGYSGIFSSSTLLQANALAIAGGGGGGPYFGPPGGGAGGGLTGEDTFLSTGGTQTAGGTSSGGQQAGSALQGASGNGGGGGGYFGGGIYAGGSGGSGFIGGLTFGTTSQGGGGAGGGGGGGSPGGTGGNGSVVITLTEPIPSHPFKQFPPTTQVELIATGGAIVVTRDYTTYHVFTSSSNFVVVGSGRVNYLFVGGGGGGGDRHGGGGGAGGVVTGSFSVTTGTYAVTVGLGGAGGNYEANVTPTPRGCGLIGGVSTISGVNSGLGGGGGGTYDGNPTGSVGSGGGGGGNSLPGVAGTAGQGNAGGAGSTNSPGGGGGGGAGGAGGDAIGSSGGIGTPIYSNLLLTVGYGTLFAIPTGPNRVISDGVAYIAGGGGGAAQSSSGPYSYGGLGGGGRGDWDNGVISAGTANTGGGGGGSRSESGGGSAGFAGGSGLVLLWY